MEKKKFLRLDKFQFHRHKVWFVWLVKIFSMIFYDPINYHLLILPSFHPRPKGTFEHFFGDRWAWRMLSKCEQMNNGVMLRVIMHLHNFIICQIYLRTSQNPEQFFQQFIIKTVLGIIFNNEILLFSVFLQFELRNQLAWNPERNMFSRFIDSKYLIINA